MEYQGTREKNPKVGLVFCLFGGCFCWLFCFVLFWCGFFVSSSFLSKLTGSKLILCEAAVKGVLKSASLYVGPVPVWGAALALAIWWSGVRCLRDMAKTLLKVMVRIGVSPVTFLSLHLSAF